MDTNAIITLLDIFLSIKTHIGREKTKNKGAKESNTPSSVPLKPLFLR